MRASKNLANRLTFAHREFFLVIIQHHESLYVTLA